MSSRGSVGSLQRRLGAVLGREPKDENGAFKPDAKSRGTGAMKRGPFADLTNSLRPSTAPTVDRDAERKREEQARLDKAEELERQQLQRALRLQEQQAALRRAEREQLDAQEQDLLERAQERQERRNSAPAAWQQRLHPCDQPVAKDPLWVAEYAEEIFENLRLQELNTPQFSADYMSRQDNISDKMRSILVDWLVEVHLKFKLTSDTLFLTVGLLDRYLAKKSVARNQLQLVGVTCLLVAAKYEEVYAPEVKDFVSITDRAYSRKEIIDMEVSVLTTLQFKLTLCSPLLFMKRYARLHAHFAPGPNDKQLGLLAQFILELTLVDYRMLKHQPSHLAAASLLLANKVMKKPDPWPQALVQASHSTEQSLRPCAKEMCALLQGAEKSSLQAVRKKFSAEAYLGVAKLLTA